MKRCSSTTGRHNSSSTPYILKLPSKLGGYSSLDVEYLGKSRFFTIFEKNLLKHFATSDSLETSSSFIPKVIFSLEF